MQVVGGNTRMTDSCTTASKKMNEQALVSLRSKKIIDAEVS